MLLTLMGAPSARANEATIVGGSTLLSQSDANQIAVWLGQGNITLERVFSKSSFTGTSGTWTEAFHAAADLKGPTISVVEAKPYSGPITPVSTVANTVIVGGYNPLDWRSANIYNTMAGWNITTNVADATAFLFNLSINLLQRQSTVGIYGEWQWQTRHGLIYGPTFGNGHDLYTGAGHGFAKNFSYGNTVEATNILGLTPPRMATAGYGFTSLFDIGEVEVFTVRASNPPGWVPTGTNVLSQPVDSTAGTSPVTITFSSVTQPGVTTLATSPTGQPPPTGFKLGNPPVYYEIGSSALYSGLVTVCINYSGVQFGNEANVRLLHFENGAWVNITTSLNTATKTVCGATTSFSPFAVFEEDAQAPVVSALVANPNPGPVGTAIAVTATVSDVGTGGSNVLSAEYSIDGGAFTPMNATDGVFNSPAEGVHASLPVSIANVHQLCVRGRDAANNVSIPLCTLLAVYDPSGGFVTGGGWILSPPGAFAMDPSLTGKANFGFVAKYLRGAQIPSGNTQFQFEIANLRFRSSVYEWLVVSGARSQFKGSGTINGAGDYGFLLTAIDGQVSGGGGVDRFRIKIWNKAGGGVVYDNQIGQPDNGDAATALGGGSIVFHQ